MPVLSLMWIPHTTAWLPVFGFTVRQGVVLITFRVSCAVMFLLCHLHLCLRTLLLFEIRAFLTFVGFAFTSVSLLELELTVLLLELALTSIATTAKWLYMELWLHEHYPSFKEKKLIIARCWYTLLLVVSRLLFYTGLSQTTEVGLDGWTCMDRFYITVICSSFTSTICMKMCWSLNGRSFGWSQEITQCTRLHYA